MSPHEYDENSKTFFNQLSFNFVDFEVNFEVKLKISTKSEKEKLRINPKNLKNSKFPHLEKILSTCPQNS